jgi:hypothetical protein
MNLANPLASTDQRKEAALFPFEPASIASGGYWTVSTNQTSSKHGGGIARVTSFTGPARSPILAFLDTATCVKKAMIFVRAQNLSNIQVLKQSLNEIHSAILDATSTNRISARRHHNSNPKVSPNVSVSYHDLWQRWSLQFVKSLLFVGAGRA